MKASELISALQKAIDVMGDIEVSATGAYSSVTKDVTVEITDGKDGVSKININTDLCSG